MRCKMCGSLNMEIIQDKIINLGKGRTKHVRIWKCHRLTGKYRKTECGHVQKETIL